MRNALLLILTMLILTNCGSKTGEQIDFNENGDTLSVYNYHDGELDGSFRIYYPGNKLKATGQYMNGQKIGVHKEYYENGMLKNYSYHKLPFRVPYYSKEFDEQGNVFKYAIPVGNHNRMSQDTLEANKPFRIGYHLDYSMYKEPRLSMMVVKKLADKYDTIVSMGSDTTTVEYDLEISKGWNHFIVELGEYTASNDTLRGLQIQELKYFGK